jgi:EAL domain-containing protein (putative c-di-GMP-specific phosphodiesterase class I)
LKSEDPHPQDSSLVGAAVRPVDQAAEIGAVETIPTYREFLDTLKTQLADKGFLALLVLDVSDIAQIEKDYGSVVYESKVYERLIEAVREVVAKLQGKIRNMAIGQSRVGTELMAALNEKAGDTFLIFFLSDEPIMAEELEGLGAWTAETLRSSIMKAAKPYLADDPEVTVGAALALRNPLLRDERLIHRAIAEARQAANHARLLRYHREKQELQGVILKDNLHTVFQPIFDLKTGTPHGFEALVRGPKDSNLRSPKALLERAERAELLHELDHLLRKRALRAGGKLERHYQLFINTYPFSVRDPSFKGQQLIELFDETRLAPEQIVLEVTEKHAIKNYPLFFEAMKYFKDMRWKVAIDDMGAGYSGLEAVVQLKPDYVKLDMYMVRDIKHNFVKQQILKILRSMAEKIGAHLIVEGVEKEEELEFVRKIGADFVQGHLLGRPKEAFQTRPDHHLED